MTGNDTIDFKVYTGDEFREFLCTYYLRFQSRRKDIRGSQEQLRKLKDSSLTLVGLGVIGFDVLCSLALLGIGKVRVIDQETVKEEDVERGAFLREDIGKQRCMFFRDRFSQFMTQTAFEWYPSDIQEMSEDAIIGDSDLIMLCSDTSSPTIHNYLNEICLRHKKNWLSARFSGYFGEVGPAVIPFKTPCYKCYEYRLKSNIDERADFLLFDKYPESVRTAPRILEIFMRQIAEYASLEIVKMLTNYSKPITKGGVLWMNVEDYTNTFHRVLRVPNCPACEG